MSQWVFEGLCSAFCNFFFFRNCFRFSSVRLGALRNSLGCYWKHCIKTFLDLFRMFLSTLIPLQQTSLARARVQRMRPWRSTSAHRNEMQPDTVPRRTGELSSGFDQGLRHCGACSSSFCHQNAWRISW